MDEDTAKAIAAASALVGAGVALVMRHFTPDFYLCFGIGILTFVFFGILFAAASEG